jgi:hypothetical protein
MQAKGAGTLILIGFGSDGVVMAADCGVFLNGKLIHHNAQKIVPVGKSGAIAMIGIEALASGQNTRIDFREMLDRCAKTTGDIESAATCLANTIQAVLPVGTQVTNSDGDRLVSFHMAGYVNGARTLIIVDFLIDPKTKIIQPAPRTKKILPPIGYFSEIGRSGFALKALKGSVPEVNDNEAINTFRVRGATGIGRYNAAEIEILFSTLLDTTESDLGQRYDEGARFVAPPNLFIVIDPNGGSRLYQLP